MATASTEKRNKGGRPPGSHQVLARKAREQAALTGLLPHEILLDMARGNPQKVLHVKELDDDTVVVEEEWVSVGLEDQMDAAKAAAPYYAPKLATIATERALTDAELDALIEQFAAQAGVGTLAGGEGEADEEEDRPRARSGTGRPERRRFAG